MKLQSLDLATLDRVSILIHGAYATGKTHLQGDYLRWATKRGRTLFVNVAGEDGWTSIAGMGLGAIRTDVATASDFDTLVAEAARDKFYAVAIDSLPALEDLVVVDQLGLLRHPDAKLDGERSKMLWGQIKLALKRRVIASRNMGQLVFWVASHDRAETIMGERRISPNLIGKSASDCIGWFDFVGEMAFDSTTKSRSVSFAPSTTVATRQRVAKTITQRITIPQDAGGWAAVWTAMEASMPSNPGPVPTKGA